MELGSINDVIRRIYVIPVVVPPFAIVVPPAAVALLPLAAVVLPVAVVVPSVACYAPLLHGALKVDAGIGNILRVMDVLEALDYCYEGGIFFCTLSIIAGLRNTTAVVVIAAVSLRGSIATLMSRLRCA